MAFDEALAVERCRMGNLRAFTDIYNHYIRRIYDFVYYKTCHRETAEDLTSQTFMKALEGIRDFDPGKGTLSSWLYRIARNSVIDHYRKRKSTVNIEDIWDLASRENLETELIEREGMERIAACLNSLPPDKRNIVIMRVWQGLSYREISEIMKRTEAQCKMTFYRAIERIKREIPASVIILFMAGL